MKGVDMDFVADYNLLLQYARANKESEFHEFLCFSILESDLYVLLMCNDILAFRVLDILNSQGLLIRLHDRLNHKFFIMVKNTEDYSP